MSNQLRVRWAAAVAVAALIITGCGGSDGESTSHDSPPAAAAEDTNMVDRGRELANSAGCAACHGTDGRAGGVGPSWVGLAGSTVTLDGGAQAVVDSAYLRRAIVDPGADVAAGYAVMMPTVNLSESEVDALVAYIEELG